jgi:zinc transport system substrate-binding protein
MKILHWTALLAIVLAGCSGDGGTERGGRPGEPGRPLVYASNYPMQYFAGRISAPLIEVRLPAPADEDPAFWVPSQEDVMAMQKADLVVLNGASYESWLKNVSLPPSRLVDTSADFRERLITEEEATTHSHGPEGEHEHSATAFTTWLDLTLAVEQARAIKDAFCDTWPEHRGQFESQFGELARELGALDDEIQKIVAGDPGVPVMFSHPVYQYFARRYGLNGKSVHWEPDEMPSEEMWRELAAPLESHEAKWMIWEGEPSPEIRERLTGLGIRSVVFDPCGSRPESGDFASMMKQNKAALEEVYSRN